MRRLNLKITKEIKIEEEINNYIQKNTLNITITEGINYVMKNLQNYRNIITINQKFITNLDKLKEMKDNYMIYINILYIVKRNILFGNKKYNVNLNFTWSDTLSNNEVTSNNINFEYYNCLFNLASIFYLIGYYSLNKENKEDISLYFKNALSIFKIIKNESFSKLKDNELLNDLYNTHLQYCCNLCIIQSQKEILKLVNDIELQIKINSNICKLFKDSFLLFHKFPLNNYLNSDEYYLNNQSILYEAITYLKIREKEENYYKEFFYGNAIYYQFLAVEKLIEYQIHIKSLNIEGDDINKLINENKEYGERMIDYNNKNKHLNIPQNENIEIIYSDDFFDDILPEILFINNNFTFQNQNINQINSELEIFIPKEVKSLIEENKNKMKEYINLKINAFSNDINLNNYIKKLNLPDKYRIKNYYDLPLKPNIDISNDSILKINQIKSLNNINGLRQIIDNIENISQKIRNKLNVCYRKITKEKKEELYLIQKFEKKYVISQFGNNSNLFLQEIEQYLNQLDITKKYDEEKKKELEINNKNFEIFNQSIDIINKNIPGRKIIGREFTFEEINIREGIQDLNILKDNINEIIKCIYECLNDDCQFLKDFTEVFYNEKEDKIFNQFKNEIDKKINEINVIINVVKEKKKILEINIQNLKIKQSKEKISEEGMNYIKALESNINLFLNQYGSLLKGFDFYNNLENKINQLISKITLILRNRIEEKNELIKALTGDTYQTFIQKDEYLKKLHLSYSI